MKGLNWMDNQSTGSGNAPQFVTVMEMLQTEIKQTAITLLLGYDAYAG